MAYEQQESALANVSQGTWPSRFKDVHDMPNTLLSQVMKTSLVNNAPHPQGDGLALLSKTLHRSPSTFTPQELKHFRESLKGTCALADTILASSEENTFHTASLAGYLWK